VSPAAIARPARPAAGRALLALALGCAAGALLLGPAGRIWVVLPLLLFAPGFLLDRAFPALAGPPPFARPAIWLGLSLSLIGLLYEWATAAGIHLTTPLLTILAAGLALAVVWALWRDSAAGQLRLAWPALALAGVFALSLAVRLVEIRDLALPPWVDSVHHALMIRVAAEQGQVPYSLRPYLAVDNLPYHWGYHVFAAAALQLSGAPLPQLMLWAGQALNALHVLACAGLAGYLWRRPLAGVLAGLVVGLISIMPAYYISWGRYTQLTGLLLLPALAIVWHAGLRAPSRRLLIYAAVLLAGLCVVHFRILIFALGLAGAITVAWAAGADRARLRAGLAFVAQGALLAIALAGPWLWLLARRALLPAIERPATQLGDDGYNALNPDLLWAGQNRILIALALAAALWGLWRRQRPGAELAGWVGALMVLANPWLATYLAPAAGAVLLLYGASYRRPLAAVAGAPLLLLNPLLVSLPYLRLIPNDIVTISLFIPIGVLVGGGGAALAGWLDQAAGARRALARQIGALLLALAALWGAWSLRAVANPATIFALPADARAIAWAAEHTPADARFLINAAPWLPGVDRGADGGWWLLPLAGRWTSTPPALFTYGPIADVRATQQRSREVLAFRPGRERELLDLIARERIGYVFLGAQPGPITRATFAGRPGFEIVYDADGVVILAVHLQS
jgi:hypothetical protein